jgi:hypothetical protein
VTLRLVADNPEPGLPDYRNIAEMLRQYANEIEAGQYGDIVSALLVLETPTKPITLGCGEEPTPYEVMGIFEAAKLHAFADHVTVSNLAEE